MRTAPSSASTATAASSAASRSACWSACPATVSRDPPAGLGHSLGWSPPCLGPGSGLEHPWSCDPPPWAGILYRHGTPPLSPGWDPHPPTRELGHPHRAGTPSQGRDPYPDCASPLPVAPGRSYKAGTPPRLCTPLGAVPRVLHPPHSVPSSCSVSVGLGGEGGHGSATSVPHRAGGVSPCPLTLLSPQPCASGASLSGRSSGCWRRCRAP